MLSGVDDTAFDMLMRELALAFDRPHDLERVRVFWDALKAVSIHDVKRLAKDYVKRGKRFPAPRDLTPERSSAPIEAKPIEDHDVIRRANALSPWARGANKILLRLILQAGRAGIVNRPLQALLDAKRDLVGGAEQDERAGQPWNEAEFITTCRESFARILGLSVEVAAS